MLTKGNIRVAVVATLAILLLIGVGEWWTARLNMEASRWVDHTHMVSEALQDTLVGILETESGYRGFAIAGDEKYLEAFYSGIEKVRKSFAAAQQLTEDNPSQQRQLELLEPLIQRKITIGNDVVAMYRRGERYGAWDLVVSGPGRQTWMKSTR